MDNAVAREIRDHLTQVGASRAAAADDAPYAYQYAFTRDGSPVVVTMITKTGTMNLTLTLGGDPPLHIDVITSGGQIPIKPGQNAIPVQAYDGIAYMLAPTATNGITLQYTIT